MQVQSTSDIGIIACPVQVLQYIMNRHYIRTGQCARQPKQVRDVYQVASQSLQNVAEFKIALGFGAWNEQRDSVKIGRQGTYFVDLNRRTDEEVFIVMILPSERPHHIADV